MELSERIKQTVRDVKDFPKEGIVFKDISTILLNADLCKDIVAHLAEKHRNSNIQGIAGIESRGFLFGFPLALTLGIPFIMIRKKGKLPYNKVSYAYQLEYGSAEIEMHSDAFNPGDRILIHDDLLATGGSAAAAAELVHKCGGKVAGFDFLVELSFLNGGETLKNYNTQITSLVQY
ncbi:MAG: adenine phosphoribosyltransferase [Bacteroidota bacterium]